jgi:hypothetical protein
VTGLVLTVAAFAVCFCLGRVSLGLGMSALVMVGYAYGILRANFYNIYTYFLFDAACLGLYLARLETLAAAWTRGDRHPFLFWSKLVVLWPFVVMAGFFLVPQHLFIQLVGLRAAVWFLPFLLLGAAAQDRDLRLLSRCLAVLNLVALAMGLAQFFWGVERFFPRNPVTELIYRSRDVAGFTAYRIPSLFSSAAAYGGTMAASLPWIFGRWVQGGVRWAESLLLTAGICAAALGVFLCGARLPFVFLVSLSAYLVLQLRSRLPALVMMAVLAAGIGYVVSSDERLQRFTTLEDTEKVVTRIQGSANLTLLEIVLEYPWGNGLGGSVGTSVPRFLLDLSPGFFQVGGENEYSRLALELGIPGLLLWIGLLLNTLLRRASGPTPGWDIGSRLVWLYAVLVWLAGLIGTGVLTAIPGAALLLFGMGAISGVAASPGTGAFGGPRGGSAGSVRPGPAFRRAMPTPSQAGVQR